MCVCFFFVALSLFSLTSAEVFGKGVFDSARLLSFRFLVRTNAKVKTIRSEFLALSVVRRTIHFASTFARLVVSLDLDLVRFGPIALLTGWLKRTATNGVWGFLGEK